MCGLINNTNILLAFDSLRIDAGSLVSQPIMLVSHQTIQFVSSEQYFAIFDFCCEVNTYINQQFASRKNKLVLFLGKDIRFCIGIAHYLYGASKKIEGSI